MKEKGKKCANTANIRARPITMFMLVLLLLNLAYSDDYVGNEPNVVMSVDVGGRGKDKQRRKDRKSTRLNSSHVD